MWEGPKKAEGGEGDKGVEVTKMVQKQLSTEASDLCPSLSLLVLLYCLAHQLPPHPPSSSSSSSKGVRRRLLGGEEKDDEKKERPFYYKKDVLKAIFDEQSAKNRKISYDELLKERGGKVVEEELGKVLLAGISHLSKVFKFIHFFLFISYLFHPPPSSPWKVVSPPSSPSPSK